jgi:ACT domain-containing protein
MKPRPLYVRFRDSVTNETIGEITEAFDVYEEELSLKTPPADLDTKAIIEISYNKENWQEISQPGKNYSY